MALLTVSVGPVGAAHTATITHTTRADFEAGTLEQVDITGSGEAASVELVDGYRQDAVARWALNGSGESVEDATGGDDASLNDAGDDGSLTRTSAGIEGGAVSFDGTDASDSVDLPASISQPRDSMTFSSWFRTTGTKVYIGADMDGDGGWRVRLGEDGRVRGAVRGQGVLTSTSSTASYNDGNWHHVALVVDNESDTMTLYVDGEAADTKTRTQPVDAGQAPRLGDSFWFASAAFDGEIDETRFYNGALEPGDIADLASAPTTKLDREGYYLTDYYDVSGAETVSLNVSLTNATVGVRVQGYNEDGSYGEQLTYTESSSSGVGTVEFGAEGYERIRVRFEFSADEPTFDAQLHSESISFPSSSPVLDNATATPATTLTDPPGALTVDISDADFGAAQYEELTAEFTLDGQVLGSDTLAGNGTASYDLPPLSGGTHTWSVDVTDQYGHTVASQTFSFAVPSELTIRSATDGDQVLTGVDVELKFYSDGEERVYTRNVPDGTIDLTGLPVGREFVVTAGSEQFYFRRAVIESIYDQESLYLLNTSTDASPITFGLDDSTGRFPSAETTLYVDRAINQSGVTTFKTVAGGNLGATASFQTTLQNDQVYRLRVRNAQNETRLLGTYVPNGEAAAPLPIGRVVLRGNVESYNESATVAQARLQTVTDGSGEESRVLRVLYYDGADTTESLTYRVVERGNESNVVVPETQVNGPFGYYVATHEVAANASSGTSYVVEVTGVRDGVADYERTVYAGDAGEIAQQWGMDPTVLSLLTWVAVVCLTGLVVIVDARAAALVMVATTGFGALVGAIHPPGIAVALAGVVAVLANVTR
jgi:phage shock protein PspC (stress-responsive transcriptional regulator)